MYKLIKESTQEVLKEGSWLDCLGAFHKLCGFSYDNHKEYTYTTYSIIGGITK